jgi:hypothetical protein
LVVHRDGAEGVYRPLRQTRFVGEQGVNEFDRADGGVPVLVVGQASRLKRRDGAP